MASKRLSSVPGVYSEAEEQFFAAGQDAQPAEREEDFADLDAGYQRVGFWQRLFGRRRA